MEIHIALVMVMITYSAPADVTSTVHYRCPAKCTCTKMTSMASSNDALRLNCSGANYVTMPVMELAANRDEGGVTSGTWYDVILDNNRLYAIDYPRVIWMWVKSLSLRHNRLDYLLGHTFCASQKLVNLSLASNHIDIIRADAFRCLTSLRLLDLSENSLAEVSLFTAKYYNNILRIHGHSILLIDNIYLKYLLF
jgi:Leucine-rich repeat (LRR) protein